MVWRRKNAVARAFIVFGAVVLAAVLGVAVVVVVGQVTGPTRPAAGAKGQTKQLVTELPPNSSPSPVLGRLDPNAKTPSTTGLAAALAPALANPALGSTAAVVVDPASGTTLFDQDGTASLQPGSTMKLFTAIAAAKAVKPGTRLTTKVVAGAAPGEIVLVGGGDPTLSSQPTSTLYPGAASVEQLAAAVRAAGIAPGSVTKVTVDDGAFAGPPQAVGWGAGDAPSTYATPIYPVMVDAGRLSPEDKAQRTANPDLAAGTALAAALGSPGAVVGRGQAGPGATLLGSVQSAPIEDLIEQALVNSDNVLAEILGRQVAIAEGAQPSFTGAVSAVTKVVQGMGVDLTGFEAHDSSGLSMNDRASAGSIASALAVMAKGDQPLTDVVGSALAVAGYNGTLATRYLSGSAAAAAGDVRAKTGSLTAVDTLAGTVVTADGRLLIFALISNGAPAQDPARAALDEVAATMAGCGCQ
ncbi:D-alanyl-D-alanine carboxypeptidase/D-alanyl-D-alanine-endopeptidase [Antricoccus suffuscus]|uniref:D-alanyl-D-alanine carboxypeptidase/D-alanyl-D-alanine endopeptidase n=1 Tax=Antricoccus suffuscus TaxID=1629062 RepID=UPI001474FAFB|nr:D-alanyl-D-alanine carboxypeptidase/D-alanyl-D-alanine-endopeptidase [Antricoccus suffuscus]